MRGGRAAENGEGGEDGEGISGRWGKQYWVGREVRERGALGSVGQWEQGTDCPGAVGFADSRRAGWEAGKGGAGWEGTPTYVSCIFFSFPPSFPSW